MTFVYYSDTRVGFYAFFDDSTFEVNDAFQSVPYPYTKYIVDSFNVLSSDVYNIEVNQVDLRFKLKPVSEKILQKLILLNF